MLGAVRLHDELCPLAVKIHDIAANDFLTIHSIISYPAMYESLKNEGLEEMKGITWEKAGQKVIDIYNQVIKK